jgi:Tfp pilus assembly protein PilX
MWCLKMIKNEKGVAMLLAVSMIGLLSVIGIWMLLQSRNSVRVTSSLERRESVFQLAEGGLRIGLRCLVDSNPSPSYSNISSTTDTVGNAVINPATSGMPTYMTVPTAPNMGRAYMTSAMVYAGYSSLPAPGWMLNAQGSTAYHSIYYKALGTGEVPLPTSAGGEARSQVSEYVVKVSR